MKEGIALGLKVDEVQDGTYDKVRIVLSDPTGNVVIDKVVNRWDVLDAAAMVPPIEYEIRTYEEEEARVS